MTDTNKEREVERLAKLMSSKQPGTTVKMEDEIAGILYDNSTDEADNGKWIEAKDYYKVAKLISDRYQHIGFLSDRVVQTFTEEGFWEWARRERRTWANNKQIIALAAEYAATLQPQQTMRRAVLWIQKDQDTWIVTGPQFTDLQSSDDYAYGDTEEEALDSYFKMKRKPVPPHPVEGEWSQIKEEENNMDGMNEWVLKDEAVRRIAATEARVREEMGIVFDTREQSAETALILELRATIADLNAKLETAVRIPLEADDVKWVVNDMAELGVEIMGQFYFLYKGSSLVYKSGLHDNGNPILVREVYKREFGECQHPEGVGVNGMAPGEKYVHGDGWKEIPRPTPKTLTNEQKAEAVMRSMGYDPDSDIGRAAGESAVYKAMLDGKSVDELYAQMKGE